MNAPQHAELIKATLAAATPHVLTLTSRYRNPRPEAMGGYLLFVQTVIIPMLPGEVPEAEDYLPTGHELLRADQFPASHFADMSMSTRRVYQGHYRAYLAWCDERADRTPSAEANWAQSDAWCKQW